MMFLKVFVPSGRQSIINRNFDTIVTKKVASRVWVDTEVDGSSCEPKHGSHAKVQPILRYLKEASNAIF
jgi:hypothetical protein